MRNWTGDPADGARRHAGNARDRHVFLMTGAVPATRWRRLHCLNDKGFVLTAAICRLWKPRLGFTNAHP